MPDLTEEQIRTVFIEPIRFALLIDDEFPVYTDAPGAETPGALRAKKLFAFCRSKGRLCDVENATETVGRFERATHLHQTDLLVLDYHLSPGNDADPTDALDIIQHLSTSPHFNLVVVLTGDDIGWVTREIGYALGAEGWKAPSGDHSRALQIIEDLEGREWDAVRDGVSHALLDQWLSGDEPVGAPMKTMRRALRDADVEDNNLQVAIAAVTVEHVLQKRLPDKIRANRKSGRPLEGAFRNGAVRWVTGGNVFVAIVAKANDAESEQPENIETQLIAALKAWNPNPLTVMMLHARAQLERNAANGDMEVLKSPERRAGWLLGAVLASTEHEKRLYLRRLYARLYDKLTQTVTPAVEDLAASLIGEPGDKLPHVYAAELARANEAQAPSIYFALNEIASSEPARDGAMTPGLVFRALRPGKQDYEYWVCTSPACDLVPGQNVKGWDEELSPVRPMTAARLTEQAIKDALKKATHGRAVFLTIDNTEMAFEVIEASSRHLRLETVLLAEQGAIKDGCFRGYVGMRGDDKIDWPELKFTVVGQLRADYAARLLTEAGQYSSRIGVDYYDYKQTT